MIVFPGDNLIGYPDRTSEGIHFPVGGAERYNLIDADLITVLDIDASTASIKDATITTAKIADAQITTAKIVDLAVTTAKINDLAVSTAKIADLAVQTGKIADAQITTAKIADAQITNAKIADLAVTNAKINDLSAAKINAGTLTVGGSGNPVQFQANDASGNTILQINNGGMVFANTGSPGLFFNNPGGGSSASLFNDGSGNLAIRAGSSDNIYFQKGDGSNGVFILGMASKVWQIGESASNGASVYFVPRNSAPDGQEGLVTFADGSGWDPGSGAGLYEYRGGAWNKL